MKRYFSFLSLTLVFFSIHSVATVYSSKLILEPNQISYFKTSPGLKEIRVSCKGRSTVSLKREYLPVELYFALVSSMIHTTCSIELSAEGQENKQELFYEVYPEPEQATALNEFSRVDSYLYGNVTFEEAELDKLLNSLNNFAKSNDDQLSVPALTRLALYYQRIYAFNISIQYANRLAEISAKSDSIPTIYNLLLAENHFSLHQYGKTLSIIETVLKSTDIKQNSTKFHIAVLTLYGFAQVLSGESNIDQLLQLQGEKTLQDALTLCFSRATRDCQSDIYNGLATYYRIQGQFDESAKMLELALSSLESNNSLDQIEQLSSLTNNLALIYRWTGNLAKSQHYLRRSIYFDRALENPVNIAISYANLANSYRLMGDLPKAKRFYQRALELSLESGDQLNTTKTQLNLGQLLIAQNDYPAAVDILSKAQATNDLSATNKQVLQSNLALALAYLGDTQQAKDLLRGLISQDFQTNNETVRAEHILSMLDIAFELKEDSVIENLERELDESKLQSTSSIIRFKHVELKTAIRRYERQQNSEVKAAQITKLSQIYNQAFTEIMRTANTLHTDEIGINWMMQTNKLTDSFIAFLLNSNVLVNYLEAWKISEQTTNLMIQRRHGYFRGRTEDNLDNQSVEDVQLKADLQKARLDSLELKPAQQRMNQLRIDALQERQLLSENAMQKAGNLTLNTLSLADTQKKLSENEVLLKYFLIGQQYFLLWANSQKWGLQKLSPQLSQFLTAYKSSDFSSGITLKIPIASEDLLPDWLISKEYIRRLIIIPDGDLHIFPFPMAMDKHGQYLGDKFEIVMTLTASGYLDDITTMRNVNNKGIAIFSDPEFSNNHDYLKGKQPDSDWYAQFQRLPWSAETANKIKTLFSSVPVKHVTGMEATNSQLLDLDMRKSKVLHIATHAYYNKHNPEQIGLVTSRDFTRAHSDQLGYISIYDILDHPIYSDLIIVSACESQMGKDYGGEGVRGLAYGMLAQGAGSVIGTLWKIPDKATSVFMKQFYQAFKENGGHSAQALQIARQFFIRSGRYKHPKYWAGFVLTVANRQYETIDLN